MFDSGCCHHATFGRGQSGHPARGQVSTINWDICPPGRVPTHPFCKFQAQETRKSMLYDEANHVLDSHNGPCLVFSAGGCSRGSSDHTKSIQRIEDKEEVHPWENLTRESRVRVKNITPIHAFFASIDNPQKRCSNVNIAVVLSVRFLLEGIIVTIAHSASIHATLMIDEQETV